MGVIVVDDWQQLSVAIINHPYHFGKAQGPLTNIEINGVWIDLDSIWYLLCFMSVNTDNTGMLVSKR